MSEIRVIVVDDHAILRDGIRSLLDRQADITVVAEASNGREALDRVHEHQPDIVLMDITMPEMNGLEATRLIKSEYPDIKVLILTQHDNQEYVDPLLQAGASGYVLKRSGGREVVTAIRQVYEEGAYLEGSITNQLLHEYSSFSNDPGPPQHLTAREKEVLNYLITGMSNKEIAYLLGISPKTVSVHRSSLMTKFNVRNSIELLRYVEEHNLLE
jgi:two-component system, NarL family, nitrate/nitrite response regulator NarL